MPGAKGPPEVTTRDEMKYARVGCTTVLQPPNFPRSKGRPVSSLLTGHDSADVVTRQSKTQNAPSFRHRRPDGSTLKPRSEVLQPSNYCPPMGPSSRPSDVPARLRARALRLSSPAKPSLLNLPLELRLQIYEIVLANAATYP